MTVQELLSDVTALLGERAGRKRLTLTLSVDPGTPSPAVDDAALKKMCYNVLEHAITSSPVAGTVNLGAGRRAIGWPDQDYVAFVVANDDAQPDRQNSQQATRMLESARASVQALGGRLWVTNGGRRQAVAFMLPTVSRRS